MLLAPKLGRAGQADSDEAGCRHSNSRSITCVGCSTAFPGVGDDAPASEMQQRRDGRKLDSLD
jgi:hypothetical protein